MISLARLFSLMKREAVLSAAAALALLSMLWVPPDGAYLSYVDWRTMAQLFCLMAVMAGLRELGVFSRLGRQLLCRVRSARQLECVLVFLCFFTSMAITNDVALLTFVPFSLEVLTLAGREERAVPVVVFQTVAANLGSMATPIGNPQNLYLYAQSGRGLGDFLALMLPYTLLSGLMLLLCLLPGRSAPLAGLAPGGAEPSLRRRRTGMYLLLFLASVSSVAKLLPVWLLTWWCVSGLPTGGCCAGWTGPCCSPSPHFSSLLETWAAYPPSARCWSRPSPATSWSPPCAPARSSATCPPPCSSPASPRSGMPLSWGPTWAGWGP